MLGSQVGEGQAVADGVAVGSGRDQADRPPPGGAAAVDGMDGWNAVRTGHYDLVISDIRMPGLDGMEVLARIARREAPPPVVMLTAHGTVEQAVEAMKLGAFDYIPKPFSPDQLVVVVNKALENRELVAENRYLRRELQVKYKFENIVGSQLDDIIEIDPLYPKHNFFYLWWRELLY